MDEYTITVLGCLMLSYDYVLGTADIYAHLGSVVSIACPIENSTEEISWTGPPSENLYAVATEVVPELNSSVSVKYDQRNRSILKINNFTADKSGLFICYTSSVKNKYNLMIKSDPTDIIIVNATDATLVCIEGNECSLECTVNSGKPGGNLSWTRNGATVANDGPSHVIFNLTPARSDHGIRFKCEAFNSDNKKILEAVIVLTVAFIPNISIKPQKSVFVKEGDKLQLECSNDGNDLTATTLWIRKNPHTILTYNELLTFKKVDRLDAGLYICRVQTVAGDFAVQSTIVVHYPPTVTIEKTYGRPQLICIPNGFPDKYIFRNWEHKTEYMENIRFLPSNNGTLEVSESVNESNRHHDRGIYICQVSNNVSSSNGLFVMANYAFNPKGKPYFVSSNNYIQYGILHKTSELIIKFVSYPNVISNVVKKNGSPVKNFTTEIQNNVKVTDTMYGQSVAVKGNIIHLKINVDFVDDFCLYEVEIRNIIGPRSWNFKLKSASGPFMPEIVRTISKKTSISLWWKPGFDGGYQQSFIIEYRKRGQYDWNNLTERLFNSTIINDLEPATCYLIRMFSRNMINDSKLTDEIFVTTDADTDKHAHLYGIASLMIIPLGLLTVTAYFKRGKVVQFINTRFNNQDGIGMIDDGLHEMQNNEAANAEVPVYSSIDRRHQLSLHQTVSYSIAKKHKPYPLGDREKQTGLRQNRLDKLKTKKDNEAQSKQDSSELNYIEVSFEPKQGDNEFKIHGLNNRTDYVDIDFSQRVCPLPYSDRDNDSDDNFASKEDIWDMKK